jgi:hypothetical protein
VERLDKSAPIRPEEVACALFYEIEELQQRLDKLEQKANPKK